MTAKAVKPKVRWSAVAMAMLSANALSCSRQTGSEVGDEKIRAVALQLLRENGLLVKNLKQTEKAKRDEAEVPAWAKSCGFIGALEDVMKDYEPVLPPVQDDTDVLVSRLRKRFHYFFPSTAARVLVAKRAMLARMSSADLVHVNGVGSSL